MDIYKLDDYSAHGTGFFAEVAKMEILSLIGTVVSYILGGSLAIFGLCVLPIVFLFGGAFLATPAAGIAEVIQGLWGMFVDGIKDIAYEFKSDEGSILEVLKLFGLEILYLIGIILCTPFCLAFSLLAIGIVLLPIISIVQIVPEENLPKSIELTVMIVAIVIYIVATVLTAISVSKEQPQYCNVAPARRR